jgi:hypothetical protein
MLGIPSRESAAVSPSPGVLIEPAMRVGIGTSPLEPRSEPKKKDNFPITMLGWMGYIGWIMLIVTFRQVREWMSHRRSPRPRSAPRTAL